MKATTWRIIVILFLTALAAFYFWIMQHAHPTKGELEFERDRPAWR